MKRTIQYTIIILSLTACHKEPEAYVPGIDFENNQKAVELISADNEFALDLFKEVSENEELENYMISPLSVAIALGMTYNGADGDTKTAFEETLRLSDLTEHEINWIHGELIEYLLKIDPKVVFEIANSIWVDQLFSLQKEFADTNVYYYDADIRTMDFGDPASVDIINGWVDDKTHHKIPEIIDEIPANVMMYLINALYFNGTWKYEFDENDNSPITFTLEDGTSEQVEGMYQEADLRVSYQNGFSILDLPYGNDKFSMLIFLPGEDRNTDIIMDHMNKENWDSWMTGLTEVSIKIRIPKFKFEYKNILNEELSDMGLGIAFGDGAADFSKMVEQNAGLFISRVIHKTFVDVNEKGTEAAAVTAVEMGYTSVGPGSVFVVDQPFLFAIREKTSGAIVFMGKVGNPVYE